MCFPFLAESALVLLRRCRAVEARCELLLPVAPHGSRKGSFCFLRAADMATPRLSFAFAFQANGVLRSTIVPSGRRVSRLREDFRALRAAVERLRVWVGDVLHVVGVVFHAESQATGPEDVLAVLLAPLRVPLA